MQISNGTNQGSQYAKRYITTITIINKKTYKKHFLVEI